MDRIEQPKPVGLTQWADESKGERGLLASHETQDIPVWLKCREDSFRFSWIRARFYPGGGPKEAQVLLPCPMCGGPLSIPGTYKTFEWELLSGGRVLMGVPGHPEAMNTVRVSVQEPCGCPHCKQWMRLDRNVLSKA